MDQILNKVGSYWFSQKANKEIDSVGDDINSLSTSIEGGAKWLVNKLKGKMQKPLPELLKEYNLAVGIFPRDATNYEFNEETKKLTVFIPSVCEVGYRDSSVLRFSTIVTGYLEKGKLADIEGMKTKVVIWVKVTAISAEGSKLYFTAGMKKSRSRGVYEVVRDGVTLQVAPSGFYYYLTEGIEGPCGTLQMSILAEREWKKEMMIYLEQLCRLHPSGFYYYLTEGIEGPCGTLQMSIVAERGLKEEDDILRSKGSKKIAMHQPGIEPGSVPWQGTILPLDHWCFAVASTGI
ncbi:hypothetical protein VitviT2T_011839 [Vitis vinifera]|uniref:DUF538 domain-containing protein n=1 Tax=Vitis vinifera TaxID=29760 RepID=A0ABY9CD18_VITVI|nr:hypothetical protein VitviT2T_011839 [Vitis vinifera]